MAKMGRPKSEDPKSFKITVRLTEAQYQDIQAYSSERRQTASKTLLDAYSLLRKREDET